MNKYEMAAFLNRDSVKSRADKKIEMDVVAQMKKRNLMGY